MKKFIVVTSINAPTACMQAFAEGAQKHRFEIIVAGDKKSPQSYELPGSIFLDVEHQIGIFPALAKKLPFNSYARKNIGYLKAIQAGAELIIDTDDDNAPYETFWKNRDRTVEGRHIEHQGWVNAYAYFSNSQIWPRGLPLDEVRTPSSRPDPTGIAKFVSPVQQGLANDNPDVDAVYRLLAPLPVQFEPGADVILSQGAWCPFNSQNTFWWPEAFPLLYLPSYCSFRMTDIWRSFIAQRIMWANDWLLSFHEATVYQDRNEHDLMRDFADEVPGYLHNRKICETLAALDLPAGAAHIPANLRKCYDALVQIKVVGADELHLIDLWNAAMEQMSK